MLSSAALVVGLLALRTSSFLIPLEVASAAQQSSPDPARKTETHVIDLHCPACPFARVDETDLQRADYADSQIHLEFSTTDKGDLLINDQLAFPESPVDSRHIFARQFRPDNREWSAAVPLDFALERSETIGSADEPNTWLVPVKFTILGLYGHPVKVDTVSFGLLTTPELTVIPTVSTIPFKDTPGATTCETTSTWSLCRLHAIVATRMQDMMKAAIARTHAAKGWVKGGCRGKKTGTFGRHHGHHGHVKQPHHHGAHQRMYQIGKMLHQTLRFFVVPALLGVIGGLMASAVGMLVGQFIVYLWLRFHRNGRRGSVRMVEAVIVDDEKDGLMVEGESPPQYMDVEAVMVEDEKH